MGAYKPRAYVGGAYTRKGKGAASPPLPVGDPLFNHVSLLAHMEGSNGGTSFADSSSIAHTLTGAGGVITSTAWKKAGNSSQYNASVGDWVQAASHSSLHLGSFDWTMECSIYLTGYAPNIGGNYITRLISKDNPSQREFGLYLQGTVSSYTSLRLIMFTSLGSSFVAPAVTYTFLLNTLYNIAVCRYLGNIYFFVNGTLLTPSAQAGANMSNGTAPLVIGSNSYPGFTEQMFGYIDEVRITKGVARYIFSYTHSTVAFPDSL